MTSNAAALIEHHLYALVADEARDPLGMAEGRDAGIGDRHHAADPQTPELPAGVLLAILVVTGLALVAAVVTMMIVL
jgi:hypothetical protein